MRFIKVFVFLALLGSPVWAQPLTVLNGNPIDISSIAEGKNLQLGLQNDTPDSLTLTFSFEAQDSNPPKTSDEKLIADIENPVTLAGNGSQDYFSVPIAPEVRAVTPGYLVINAESNDNSATAIRIEAPFINLPKFEPQWWAAISAPIIAISVVMLALLLGHRRPIPDENISEGWIAGLPQVSFTESFGSLSTLLLAVTNAGLLPAISALTEPGTRSLQVLGFIFALPIILAPMILRFSLSPVRDDEELCKPSISDEVPEEKTRVEWFLIASGISLTGTLLQTYVLYEWLKLLDLSFLRTTSVLVESPRNPVVWAVANFGWAAAISSILAALIVVLGVTTVRYALINLRLCKTRKNEEEKKPICIVICGKVVTSPDKETKPLLQAPVLAQPIVLRESRPRRKLRNTLF